ncbi:MAG: ABC transporter ATP-binding protein, partial [Oscillospiraceae bacterium]|nr:ABC transporter ATP-binding protein [Oscillospiraceae bacterium]
MNNYALEVNNLCKEFSDFKLDNVSFKLEKGMVMGLVGENGAGKTTIIKLILNAMNKTSGSISVFGLDSVKDEVEAKKKIGYVADDDYLYVTSNIKKYAKAFATVYENWDQQVFEKYAKMWNLPPKKKFSEYSKGMRTKAMLALTLGHNPDILILDEPTAGLDPVARIEVLDILRDIVSEGERAVLFSTHITGDLDKIADSITVLINGKVTEST